MSNPRYSDTAPSRGEDKPVGPMDKAARAPSAAVSIKTANWPSLPGKAGPNRSNGVAKASAHAKSEGV